MDKADTDAELKQWKALLMKQAQDAAKKALAVKQRAAIKPKKSAGRRLAK